MHPFSSPRSVRLAASLALALAATSGVVSQETDEVIWHNRYHALLAMAAYGDYNTLCPQQTFTREGLAANFPNETADPWTILETFGPTAHGAEGFSAYIPETNKVTLVFKGDYNLEKNLPLEQADLSAFGLGERCTNCRANAFALAGYLEAFEATNGFATSIERFREIEGRTNDFYFSVTGHGLGGAHAILATIHLGSEGIITFSHNYGTPRILNHEAAAYHNFILGGNQLDRGGANADMFMHMVPLSDQYVHPNTGIWYHGYNETFHMNSEFCYEEPENPRCLPSGDLNEEDHYFYFVNVGQCGGRSRQDMDVINAFLAEERAKTVDSNISRTMPAALTTGAPIAVANATSSVGELTIAAANATSANGAGAASTAISRARTSSSSSGSSGSPSGIAANANENVATGVGSGAGMNAVAGSAAAGFGITAFVALLAFF